MLDRPLPDAMWEWKDGKVKGGDRRLRGQGWLRQGCISNDMGLGSWGHVPGTYKHPSSAAARPPCRGPRSLPGRSQNLRCNLHIPHCVSTRFIHQWKFDLGGAAHKIRLSLGEPMESCYIPNGSNLQGRIGGRKNKHITDQKRKRPKKKRRTKSHSTAPPLSHTWFNLWNHNPSQTNKKKRHTKQQLPFFSFDLPKTNDKSTLIWPR